MDVQVEKTEAYLCKLSISIPAEDVNKAFDKAWRKVSKSAQVPGFRPGHVPRGLIERQFGAQIAEEVRTQIVEETLFKAIDKAALAPVSMPRLTLGVLNRDAIFAYTAEVEVRPEITLEKHTGLPVPPENLEVTDAQVDKELATMAEKEAQLVPVTGRDISQEGDVISLDYVGKLGDEPFDGGRGENAEVELGGKDYIPGFAEALVGVKVPGPHTFTVTFPEDYNAQHLAGKEATFECQVKDLKVRERPALDEEFARDVGQESLEALKTKVRQDLTNVAQRESDNTRRTAVLRGLVQANPFPLPPSMVESQLDRIVEGAAQRFERMTGQKVQLGDEQVQALRKASRDDADFQVRSGLLMMEVAKAAKVEVVTDEIEAEIERVAQTAGAESVRVHAFYNDAERREELRYALLEDKVVKLLLETSTVAEPAVDATASGDKSDK